MLYLLWKKYGHQSLLLILFLLQTPIPYRSLTEGIMHACGHDAHTSMLLGAVRLLKAHENSLEGIPLYD